jgi:hypothetical protein
VAQRLGQQVHVALRDLADLGYRVDERDLRGQERVRRDLHQFGRVQVGDQERRPSGDRPGVQVAQHGGGALGLHAGHDPVRSQHVLDGVALAQELRAPGELGLRREQGQPFGQPAGGADGHGGFPHEQGGPRHQRDEGVDALVQLGEVGPVGAGRLRSADAQEVDIAERHGFGVGGGEGQAASGQPSPQQRPETGLVERHDAVAQRLNPDRVGVHPEHLETQAGQARRLRRAQIPGAEDGQSV